LEHDWSRKKDLFGTFAGVTKFTNNGSATDKKPKEAMEGAPYT
jgi:hypothetical protein